MAWSLDILGIRSFFGKFCDAVFPYMFFLVPNGRLVGFHIWWRTVVRRNCGASVEAMANACRSHRSTVMTNDISMKHDESLYSVIHLHVKKQTETHQKCTDGCSNCFSFGLPIVPQSVLPLQWRCPTHHHSLLVIHADPDRPGDTFG